MAFPFYCETKRTTWTCLKELQIFHNSSSLEYRPSLFVAVRLLLFHLPSSRSRSLKKLQASQTSRSMVSKYVPGWLAEPPAHWEKSYRNLGEESSQKSGGNPNQKKRMPWNHQPASDFRGVHLLLKGFVGDDPGVLLIDLLKETLDLFNVHLLHHMPLTYWH